MLLLSSEGAKPVGDSEEERASQSIFDAEGQADHRDDRFQPPGNTPRGLRRKAVRLALAAATIVALAGIVAHDLLTEAPAVPPALPHSGASSDAPLSSLPGAVQAAVDGNVEYATVTVGNTTHSGRLPIATTLHPGDNAITFSAPPFAALTCDIVLPQITVRGDCTLQSAQGPVDPRTPASSQGGSAVTVMFGVGATALDPAALRQATAAVSNALSTLRLSATVPSGEYYAIGLDAGGNIVSARATSPLQARAWLAPLEGTPVSQEHGCGADPLCPGDAGPRQGVRDGVQAWWIDLRAAIRWEYGAGGRTVATSAPYQEVDFPLRLTYSASAGWSAAGPDGSSVSADVVTGNLCSPANELIAQAVRPQWEASRR